MDDLLDCLYRLEIMSICKCHALSKERSHEYDVMEQEPISDFLLSSHTSMWYYRYLFKHTMIAIA